MIFMVDHIFSKLVLEILCVTFPQIFNLMGSYVPKYYICVPQNAVK